MQALGLTLPEVSAPVANYVPAVRTGNLLFFAGQAPRDNSGAMITGKVGADGYVRRGTMPLETPRRGAPSSSRRWATASPVDGDAVLDADRENGNLLRRAC